MVCHASYLEVQHAKSAGHGVMPAFSPTSRGKDCLTNCSPCLIFSQDLLFWDHFDAPGVRGFLVSFGESIGEVIFHLYVLSVHPLWFMLERWVFTCKNKVRSHPALAFAFSGASCYVIKWRHWKPPWLSLRAGHSLTSTVATGHEWGSQPNCRGLGILFSRQGLGERAPWEDWALAVHWLPIS